MSKKAVKSYMSKKDNGGDPVTALPLRHGSSSKSVAKRRSKVELPSSWHNSKRFGQVGLSVSAQPIEDKLGRLT
ncbi:hypothetical protein PG997_001722 [Apiospora hydei]|uniref:Uncharacterized protein n=1 Tax=Apiospora hydei TaxID=1337664 RepID=A0ABR1XEB7_9PEZI